jgi:hypothetical protein
MKTFRSFLTEDWVHIKRLINVREPLFHATSSFIAIKNSGEIKDSTDTNVQSRFGSQQFGISMSRNLNPLLSGRWGNSILVLDRRQIQQKYKIEPFQLKGVSDEFEDRVLTKSIPSTFIKAVVMTMKNPSMMYQKEWSGWPFDVIVNIDDEWKKL